MFWSAKLILLSKGNILDLYIAEGASLGGQYDLSEHWARIRKCHQNGHPETGQKLVVLGKILEPAGHFSSPRFGLGSRETVSVCGRREDRLHS